MQTKELKTMVLGPRCGKSTFIKSLSGTNPNTFTVNGNIITMEYYYFRSRCNSL